MHIVAELSNPFLIIRSVMKIFKVRTGAFYTINERLFAGTFLLMRMIVTPLLMIAIYEADNCIYTTKLCIGVVLFIQLFWCYKILILLCQAVE